MSDNIGGSHKSKTVKWYIFYSETHKRDYFYNPETGVSQWVMPENYTDILSVKKKRDETNHEQKRSSKASQRIRSTNVSSRKKYPACSKRKVVSFADLPFTKVANSDGSIITRGENTRSLFDAPRSPPTPRTSKEKSATVRSVRSTFVLLVLFYAAYFLREATWHRFRSSSGEFKGTILKGTEDSVQPKTNSPWNVSQKSNNIRSPLQKQPLIGQSITSEKSLVCFEVKTLRLRPSKSDVCTYDSSLSTNNVGGYSYHNAVESSSPKLVDKVDAESIIDARTTSSSWRKQGDNVKERASKKKSRTDSLLAKGDPRESKPRNNVGVRNSCYVPFSYLWSKKCRREFDESSLFNLNELLNSMLE